MFQNTIKNEIAKAIVRNSVNNDTLLPKFDVNVNLDSYKDKLKFSKNLWIGPYKISINIK